MSLYAFGTICSWRKYGHDRPVVQRQAGVNRAGDRLTLYVARRAGSFFTFSRKKPPKGQNPRHRDAEADREPPRKRSPKRTKKPLDPETRKRNEELLASRPKRNSWVQGSVVAVHDYGIRIRLATGHTGLARGSYGATWNKKRVRARVSRYAGELILIDKVKRA